MVDGTDRELRSKMQNVVLIMTDEERFPVPEENEQVQMFRRLYMPGHRFFKENATELSNHMINGSACRASRGNIFTGHPVATTRIRNTNGFAKEDDDPGLAFDLATDSNTWFPSKYLPTMGHYFRSIGYQTYYVGKWHISQEDIGHNNGSDTHTVKKDGKKHHDNFEKYKELEMLEKFGFKGWVGDEPHGPSSNKSGVYVDPHYTEQAIEILNYINSPKNPDNGKPFLLVVSYVNPHDIVLWVRRCIRTRMQKNILRRGLTNLLMSKREEGKRKEIMIPRMDHIPDIDEYVSNREDISTKPKVQEKYRKLYPRMIVNDTIYKLLDSEEKNHRRYYLYMMHLVSKQIETLMNNIKTMPFYDRTFIVQTSDHGELLGSHHGLQQKWHCAYNEVIHVPMYVYHSKKLNIKREVDTLTCHLDIIPTLLGLATSDITEPSERVFVKDILNRVKNNFVCQNNLEGIDLSEMILKGDLLLHRDRNIYFNTEDQISKGKTQVSVTSKINPLANYLFDPRYESIKGADCVEAIIKEVELSGEFVLDYINRYNGYLKLYNIKNHTTKIDVLVRKIRSKEITSIRSIVKLVRYYDKEKEERDEWEMYIIELDPSEIINIKSQRNRLTNLEYQLFRDLYHALCISSKNDLDFNDDIQHVQISSRL